MCVVDKCCYYIKLNLGCVLLGIANFVISTTMTIAAMVCYFSEQDKMDEDRHFVEEFLGLDLKMSTVNIILSVIVLVGAFWMIFSVMLTVGVLKNEPSLVLSYFSFGIILTILWQLAGLILLLNKCWWLSFITTILSMLNIHFSVVVYSVYDRLQNDKELSFQNNQNQDEDFLISSFDENIDV